MSDQNALLTNTNMFEASKTTGVFPLQVPLCITVLFFCQVDAPQHSYCQADRHPTRQVPAALQLN